MENEKNPKGLPETDPTEEHDETPAVRSARVRVCDKCGKGGARVASNSSGVTAFCTCGYFWPIAGRPMGGSIPMAPSRGLSKQTLVEPDWNKAFEDMEGAMHDKVGPKREG